MNSSLKPEKRIKTISHSAAIDVSTYTIDIASVSSPRYLSS